jgi:uncharacterized repeat protein (TIGR01451 family)
MDMKTPRTILVFLIATSMFMTNVSTARALQPSPSSFHGTVNVNGSNVPVGTSITAWINGVQYISAAATLDTGHTVYKLDVPGDDPEVAGIQGGVEGDTISFHIGDLRTVQTATWHGDTDVQLNLTGTHVPTGFTCTTLEPKQTTTSTGEKPQSKVWTYAGSWYAVFPTSTAGASSAGTWVWRLAGTTWTEVLRLSTRTNTHADVLVDGPLAHILLWAGNNTQLASIAYVGGTYQLWATRNTLVNISLPNSETATIALDSTGEMWLATRTTAREIVVYHSPSPYSTWNGSITLETGVNNDDIEVITALPNGSVGVFWSNQNVQRFGFRYHVDGQPATTWSVNEVPASQSALNVGSGMADDHMNVAVASDSTFYVAIKTSYDDSRYPKMALLVRRPDGTWDDLHPVDNAGTRPLVLLDENNDSLTFIYTSTEGNNSIVYQQASTQGIAFEGRLTLRSENFNDVSSMKSNIEDGFVVIYSSNTVVAGQYCSMETGLFADLAISQTGSTSKILPGDSLTHTITATNNGPDDVVNAIVADSMPVGLNAISWTCIGAGGGTCTASGSGSINDTVNLPAGATVTYTVQAEVAPGIGGSLTNTATITTPIGTTDPTPGNNSSSYTYILTGNLPCGTDPTLVGCWQMEENSGLVLQDGSSYANDADIYGAPAWVTGIVGNYALDLDDNSDYALVPDDPSLDIADQITIMAWIKPEQVATQDLIKKAIQGSATTGINGYELSLATTKTDASSQRVFFRINQASISDAYRINSATMYPIDGTWMHVAATYDGTTMRLYINGVQEAYLTPPAGTKIALNDVPLSIGAQSTPARYFKGWMDEARVYRRALSPAEIKAFMNFPPVAVDDAYGTPEDTVLNVSAPGVLSNDIVADLVTLTAIKVTDPAHGILTLNANGSFTYDPEANWSGSDSFTYKANDTQADSNTANVAFTVTAVNDAPVVTDIPDQTIADGASFATLSLDGYVSDVDNTDAEMTWLSSGNTALSVSILNRVATITIPNADWNGSETITFRAADPGHLYDEDAATFTVTPVNDAPVCVDVTLTTAEDTPGDTAPACTDVDAGDTLTYSIVAQGSNGTASVDAGVLHYAPNPDFNGSDSFTYKANDTHVDSNTSNATVNVTPVNDAPVLDAIGPKIIAELVPLMFTATATDIDLPADTLIYSLADGIGGSVPEGAGIDSTSGAFSWTPTEAQGPETYTFDVCVSDGSGSECETITVTVSEAATSTNAVPDAYDVMQNGILLVPAPGVLANDSDVDIPTDTLIAILDSTTMHGHLVLKADGAFTYTPDAMWSGMDTFTYKVYDGTSYSEVVSVTITVKLFKLYLLLIYK